MRAPNQHRQSPFPRHAKPFLILMLGRRAANEVRQTGGAKRR